MIFELYVCQHWLCDVCCISMWPWNLVKWTDKLSMGIENRLSFQVGDVRLRRPRGDGNQWNPCDQRCWCWPYGAIWQGRKLHKHLYTAQQCLDNGHLCFIPTLWLTATRLWTKQLWVTAFLGWLDDFYFFSTCPSVFGHPFPRLSKSNQTWYGNWLSAVCSSWGLSKGPTRKECDQPAFSLFDASCLHCCNSTDEMAFACFRLFSQVLTATIHETWLDASTIDPWSSLISNLILDESSKKLLLPPPTASESHSTLKPMDAGVCSLIPKYWATSSAISPDFRPIVPVYGLFQYGWVLVKRSVEALPTPTRSGTEGASAAGLPTMPRTVRAEDASVMIEPIGPSPCILNCRLSPSSLPLAKRVVASKARPSAIPAIGEHWCWPMTFCTSSVAHSARTTTFPPIYLTSWSSETEISWSETWCSICMPLLPRPLRLDLKVRACDLQKPAPRTAPTPMTEAATESLVAPADLWTLTLPLAPGFTTDAWSKGWILWKASAIARQASNFLIQVL